MPTLKETGEELIDGCKKVVSTRWGKIAIAVAALIIIGSVAAHRGRDYHRYGNSRMYSRDTMMRHSQKGMGYSEENKKYGKNDCWMNTNEDMRWGRMMQGRMGNPAAMQWSDDMTEPQNDMMMVQPAMPTNPNQSVSNTAVNDPTYTMNLSTLRTIGNGTYGYTISQKWGLIEWSVTGTNADYIDNVLQVLEAQGATIEGNTFKNQWGDLNTFLQILH